MFIVFMNVSRPFWIQSFVSTCRTAWNGMKHVTSKPQRGPPKAGAQSLQRGLHRDPKQRCRGWSGGGFKCEESVWVDWKLSIKTHKRSALKERHASSPILLIFCFRIYAPLSLTAIRNADLKLQQPQNFTKFTETRKYERSTWTPSAAVRRSGWSPRQRSCAAAQNTHAHGDMDAHIVHKNLVKLLQALKAKSEKALLNASVICDDGPWLSPGEQNRDLELRFQVEPHHSPHADYPASIDGDFYVHMLPGCKSHDTDTTVCISMPVYNKYYIINYNNISYYKSISQLHVPVVTKLHVHCQPGVKRHRIESEICDCARRFRMGT